MPLEPRKPRQRPLTLEERNEIIARHKTTRGKTPDRYAALITGELTVDDLDEEEIMRGQLRNKRGDFAGRQPNLIPRQFATAIAAKQKEITARKMVALVDTAVKTLEEVMLKPHPQPGDNAKVNAAKLVLERYMGRVPETINMRAEVSVWKSNVERFVQVVRVDEPPKELEQ